MATKFSSRVGFQEQLPALNQAAEKTIKENIRWTARTTYEKVVFSVPYFVFAILTYIFLIGFILMQMRASAWGKRMREVLPLSVKELYQKTLDEAFTNIKVLDKSGSISRAELKKNKGVGIPYDAWIVSVTNSPVFQLDEAECEMSLVTWKWKRDKETYTKTKTYTRVTNMSSKYSKLNFNMAKNGLIHWNKGKDMENNAFNKAYSFKHNDPVKFRMLFTVSSQEKFVNLKKDKAMFLFDMNKTGDWMMLSHGRIGTPFEINVGLITSNQSKLEGKIIKDLQNDLRSVLETFKVIYSIPTLVNK